MTHSLQGRSDAELLWFRRRGLLASAAAWVSLGGFAAAQAQQRGNVMELEGDVLVNGQRLRVGQSIQSGDALQTGSQSRVVFVVGDSSFLMRQNSQLVVERGATLYTVSALRLITGAVAAVWGRGKPRQIITPTLTAGIRGTGIYTEVFPDQEGGRSYFCNCYGTVDMAAGPQRVTSVSEYHQSFFGEREPRNGKWLTPAPAINHADEELEFLARLVGQRTTWQIAGRRGNHDGSGRMSTPYVPEPR